MRKHLSYRQFDERLRTFSQWLYFCIWLSISSLIYFIYCGRTYSHHRVNTNNLYESNTNSQHVRLSMFQESRNLSTSCMTIETIKPAQVDWIECKRIRQFRPIYFFSFFRVKMFTVAICLFFRKTKLSVLVACNKLQTESTNAAAIYKTKDFPSTIAYIYFINYKNIVLDFSLI